MTGAGSHEFRNVWRNVFVYGIMTTIASNLQAVRDAISAAAVEAGRHENEVMLLAVSKTFAPDSLREVYGAGQTCFAESYLQEALDKIAVLHDLDIDWHFIGPIQSNKTRAIAENFAWVHSVDRLKIAQRLSEQRPAHLPPLQVCLQVNISGEDTKSGQCGLMAVPAPADDVAAQRLPFAQLRKLRDELNRQGLQLDTLSMGMSHDFAAAIAEGATIVRIGTAIFGDRPYRNA